MAAVDFSMPKGYGTPGAGLRTATSASSYVDAIGLTDLGEHKCESWFTSAGLPLARGLTFACLPMAPAHDGELGRLPAHGATAPGGESCGSAGCGGAGGPGGGLFNLMGWMQANAFAAAAAMFLMVHLVRMLPGILAMHMSTGALSAAQVRAMSVHISAEDAHV